MAFYAVRAGTDVMLLDNFSTDGSSHLHHHGNLAGKRRSSVTFEDQVDHSKGVCWLSTRQQQITDESHPSRKKKSKNWGNNPLLSTEQKYVAINLYL